MDLMPNSGYVIVVLILIGAEFVYIKKIIRVRHLSSMVGAP